MNALLRTSFTGLLFISASTSASDVSIPHTFLTGTPAVANQINANFTALENAVDDNDARLDALEPSANPIVVNCTSSPNGLQTALSSPRTGKLIINFIGICNPILITRSDVEIVGNSKATASIAGASGAWNASVTIKNANNVKLKSLEISRNDDEFMVGVAWRSNVTLEDIAIEKGLSLAPEGFGFIQSRGSIKNVIAENIGVFISSSVIFEDGNSIVNTMGGGALEINESSSVMVIGSNNTISSTGDVLDMASESSLGFNSDGATGNSINGNIYISQSSINFANDVAVNGNIFINQGSSVYWEGSDGGPRTDVTANFEVNTNSNLQLRDVNLTGNIRGMRGASATAQNSSISAGIELHSFATFHGWDNTTINGGQLNGHTNFHLDGPSSNISGTWVTQQFNAGYMNATHTGATFNCSSPGHGDIYVNAYSGLPNGSGVCNDGDSDGVLNYLDDCPAVASGEPDGCPP